MGIVELNHCIDINRLIEEGFDREAEDYSLTVTSAGLDQPLKVFRQYQKWMGKEVELVLRSGGKLKGVLSAATEEEISLSHEKSEKVEGKKKKEKITITENFLLKDIKSTKPIIHFK
jgi:ribosome maturation factor RimP